MLESPRWPPASRHDQRIVPRKVLRHERHSAANEIVRRGEDEPRRRRQRPLHQRRIRNRPAVRPNGKVIALTDDIDPLVAGVLDHVYFWMLPNELRQYPPQC